jgi:hypothetical protein
MSSPLETWKRSAFVPGGGDPFLFYVIYGSATNDIPMSRKTYRSNGEPDGLQIMEYGPRSHPEVPAQFREGYLWDEFMAEDPTTAKLVAACESCLVLRGEFSDPSDLDYLRDTVGLITYLLDQGRCVVYDPQMFRWWGPQAWKRNFFDPNGPVPRHHVAILMSPEIDPSLMWYHTRGMRKFGRPDLSIRNVPARYAPAVEDFCNRMIEHLAWGHVVQDGQEIRMASLPRGSMRLAGDLDDPDFNNVHLAVTMPFSAHEV